MWGPGAPRKSQSVQRDNTGWKWLASTHRVFPLLDGFEVGCDIRQTRREEIPWVQEPGISEEGMLGESWRTLTCMNENNDRDETRDKSWDE